MRQVTLVTGPPCAGKSTFVEQHAQPGDLIVCMDTLAVEAGSEVGHGHEGKHWQAAKVRYAELCDHIFQAGHIRAWVIRGAPDPRAREHLADWVIATRVVVLLPTQDVAYQRGLERDDPTTCRAISSWFRRYRPSALDETIAT